MRILMLVCLAALAGACGGGGAAAPADTGPAPDGGWSDAGRDAAWAGDAAPDAAVDAAADVAADAAADGIGPPDAGGGDAPLADAAPDGGPDGASDVPTDVAPPPLPDYDDLLFEGFGRNARGGTGGPTVAVTSLADDGPGTLREALRSAAGPTIVRFEVDGEIVLADALDLPSELTLDARGRDVTLVGCGLRLWDRHDVVLLNLAFEDVSGPPGDAIQIGGDSHDIQILHCRFDSAGLMPFVEDVPDEQVSHVVFGARDITIAWSRFENHDKVLLFGNGDAAPEVDEAIAVTLHHNVFHHTGRRHPFLRHGRVDLVNNVISDWREYLELPYGTRSSTDAEILAERNWYEQDDPRYSIAAWVEFGGRIRLVDNHFDPPSLIAVASEPDLVFERPYPLRVHELSPAWRALMEERAGNTLPAPPPAAP